MLPSVRAFFSGIIDYAGLFPPARLPLDQAMRNYARYRNDPESWMLGRFVCSAGQLPTLLAYGHKLFPDGESFTLSVVVSVAEGEDNEMVEERKQARRALQDFCKQFSGRVGICIEARLGGNGDLTQFVFAGDLVDVASPGPSWPLITTYYEHPLQNDWRNDVRRIIAALENIDPLRHRGYKLRCGGMHASNIPSIEQVAYIIGECRDASVPLKFTAGLHHPKRHYDAGVQTHMHGFLNVFGAGVLAHARKLSEGQIRDIVADEDPGSFAFTEDGFRWKDQFASVAEITAARQHAVISFGSCSFDEPREELQKMGLL